jgi:hypothetical protein
MDLLQRYPWLSGGQTAAQSWKSLSIEPAFHFALRQGPRPAKPVLTWVTPALPIPTPDQRYMEGSGSRYLLSKDGERYLDLISPEE